MANQRPTRRIAQLWQLPLLLLSLGLFGFAGYLFIDPKPGLTKDQKIETAAKLLQNGRPTAAIEQLNSILREEKLDEPQEGRIHLLMAESFEAAQIEKKLNIASNHEQIISESLEAMKPGRLRPEAEIYRRMGDSYAALDRPADAERSYRKAMELEPDRWVSLQRHIIELQLSLNDNAGARQSLDEYLNRSELATRERAWAMGQKAHVLVESGGFVEARTILNEALRLRPDDVSELGQLNYWFGYCAWKLRDYPEADRYLRLSRDQLTVANPLDADAALLLGKIQQARDDHPAAISFFEVVITSHPDSPSAPLAWLGRGVSRLVLGQFDGGLTDLHYVVRRIGGQDATRDARRAATRDETLAALRRGSMLLADNGNYTGALELLGYEGELEASPAAEFFTRLAQVRERQSDQLESTVANLKPADQQRAEEQIRKLRTEAGDARVAYARAVAIAGDDKSAAPALWQAVQLYNRAGAIPRVITALEMYSSERPNDPQTPEALLELGMAYQAAGQFDKAISTFQRNQFRHPTNLSAVRSAVPLARAYMAKGPDYYAKAESALRAVVENNPVTTPDAAEFREALFELAQLYYRNGRYEESIARFEEFTQRYPNEDRTGQLLFHMADGYRKSAALLEQKIASMRASESVQQAAEAAEAGRARRERLTKAKALYDRAIEAYKAHPPANDLDQLYAKMSHFYRADCLFDLGDYVEAIKLYDFAAFRYQDDASALAAYVQIVNANVQLGRIAEAQAANERAKWLLRRMPPETLKNGSLGMPSDYWEKWLNWSSNARVW